MHVHPACRLLRVPGWAIGAVPAAPLQSHACMCAILVWQSSGAWSPVCTVLPSQASARRPAELSFAHVWT